MPVSTIFEISKPGRNGFTLPELDVPRQDDLIPEKFLRQAPPDLPEVDEGSVIRHFVNLSNMNHHVDKGFYPLGSCTMKYNPKVNERLPVLKDSLSFIRSNRPLLRRELSV